MVSETRITIRSEADLVAARQQGRALASKLGFSPIDQTLIATAISEVARNILTYARHGEITLRPLQGADGRHGLAIVARDEGPGIPDVALALQDGYSTSGSLGLGLPGAKRMMDEFDIVSAVGQGTTVTMKKWQR